jgi:photosystem II stability/assembly factor-like uncharacterized protein
MSNYLDQIEEQLSELTKRGAHRRLRARRPAFGGSGGPRPPRRRSSELFAVLAGVAVAAVVVAIIVLNVGTSPRHATPAASRSETATATTTATATHSSATVPGKPTGQGSPSIPANFHPQSFTAISELTWWVLGAAPCSLVGLQPPCGAILRTTDGGRSFTALEAPLASLAGRLSTSGYSQIRFADLRNGFAYGPNLYATHDGGATWQPVDVGGDVSDLAISDGEVYAIVSPPPGSAGQLMRSPVGQDQWSTVTAAGRVSGGLWVLGHEVLAQSASGPGYGAHLLVSDDGGASFTSYPAPSPGLPCDFQAQSTPVIWANCATGTESGVWRSTDGGASFTSAVAPGAHLMLPNSAVFAAASDTTAVVGYQQLYRTSDAGATWAPVGPPGIAQWAYLGFTDATHGVALGYVGSVASGNERLYYTTDGGQTYHLVSRP